MSHGKFKVYQTGLTVSMRLSSDTCRLLVNVNGYNRVTPKHSNYSLYKA